MNDILRAQFKKYIESGETLVIADNLTIDDDELFEVPYLRVRGNLTLKNMFNLHRIWGLEIAGNLVVESCDLVEMLPRLCTVGKALILKDNTLLKDLGLCPSCKALEIDSCPSLSILELGIDRCESIIVKHCQNLGTVTQKRMTWVPSKISIENCGLVSVPSGLKAGSTFISNPLAFIC